MELGFRRPGAARLRPRGPLGLAGRDPRDEERRSRDSLSNPASARRRH